jgi:hypothetical protein
VVAPDVAPRLLGLKPSARNENLVHDSVVIGNKATVSAGCMVGQVGQPLGFLHGLEALERKNGPADPANDKFTTLNHVHRDMMPPLLQLQWCFNTRLEQY